MSPPKSSPVAAKLPTDHTGYWLREAPCSSRPSTRGHPLVRGGMGGDERIRTRDSGAAGTCDLVLHRLIWPCPSNRRSVVASRNSAYPLVPRFLSAICGGEQRSALSRCQTYPSGRAGTNASEPVSGTEWSCRAHYRCPPASRLWCGVCIERGRNALCLSHDCSSPSARRRSHLSAGQPV